MPREETEDRQREESLGRTQEGRIREKPALHALGGLGRGEGA